jgi:hypothetical protein
MDPPLETLSIQPSLDHALALGQFLMALLEAQEHTDHQVSLQEHTDHQQVSLQELFWVGLQALMGHQQE